MANTSKRNTMATLKNEYITEEELHRIHLREVESEEDTLAIPNEVDGIVYDMVEKHGPVTRPKLVELTGIPRTTLYDSLIRLMLRGIVRKFEEERKKRGRPKVYYQLTT